jgi:hypothetical protein
MRFAGRLNTAWHLFLAVVPLAMASASSVRADTLTFDDVTTASFADVPNGYGGLNWSNMGVYDGSGGVGGSGYINGRVSGTYVAFNEYALTATVSHGSFTFNSAYFTAAWNNGLNVTVDGYLNNVLVDTKSFTVDTAGPTLVNFDFQGIDKLVFNSFGCTPDNTYLGHGAGAHFAMDNFTFNEATVAPLPSPVLMGMTLLGGTGLAHFFRRRKLSL